MNNTGFLILFIIADVALLTLLIIWLLRYENKKVRSRTNRQFDDYALLNRLRFDNKQSLNKNMIGIDRENMKLAFLDRSKKSDQIFTLDLQEINRSRFIKKRKNPNGHISKIFLEISFTNPAKESVVLPFYDEKRDKYYKMMRLAKKALYWNKTINLFKQLPETADTESIREENEEV